MRALRALFVLSLAAPAVACGEENPRHETEVTEARSALPEAEESAVPSELPAEPTEERVAAVDLPTVLMPTRARGPFESMCAGVRRFPIPDLEEPLECVDAQVVAGDEMGGRIIATLDSPPQPYLEARVFAVPSGLRLDETAATFLGLQTAAGWWLELLEHASPTAVGYAESCGVMNVELHAIEPGPMVRVDFDRRCLTDVNQAGSEEEMDSPSQESSALSSLLCRALDRVTACVEVAIGGHDRTTETGGSERTQEEWSRELTILSPSRARLGPIRGSRQVDDELEGDIELAFEDTARARARGFANRCSRLRRAERLTEARAACEQGLRAEPRANEAGALHYEMGRIDETSGNIDAARASYRRSLAARPGNELVRQRLDSL